MWTRLVGFTNSFGVFKYCYKSLDKLLVDFFLHRRLAQDLTHPLITTLQQECSRTTCPEMKAGEWLYLCVAHGTEGAMEVSHFASIQIDHHRC